MKIYKSEINDGIADTIQANASIAYCQPIFKTQLSEADVVSLTKAAQALTNPIQFTDLYPTDSILVSTIWNLNDDVFDKEEVWEARKTPEDKPSNLNHAERDIVGHITGCYAMDLNGNIIPDYTIVDDLPEVYHIVNSGVIYRVWQDATFAEKVQDLISAIERNEMFVSMECVFRGFDYAVVGPDGKNEIISRTEATAFLSKHLRAYGGEGKYQGYKIGRLLRNITFSGKGYVTQPANPGSIIFTKDKGFSFVCDKNNPLINKDGVYLLQMPKASIVNPEKETVVMNENETKLAAQVADLVKEMDALKASLEAAKNENATLAAELKTVSEVKASLDAELNQVRAAEKLAKRIATLTEGGFTKEEAEVKVKAFESLTDEQYALIASELVEAAKKKKDADKFMENKIKCAEDEAKKKSEADAAAAKKKAEEEAISKAKLEGGVIIPQSGEPDEVAKTRASLTEMFGKLIAKKTKVKITK